MKPALFLTKTWAAFLAAMLVPAAALALMADHQCAFCHDLHGAAGNPLLGESNAELVCDSCHAPGVTGSNVSSLKATVHTGNHFPANRITCLGCHDAHDYQQNKNGVDNLDLVLATISVMNFPAGDITAVFADTDYSDGSYDYAKPDGTGICQVCHTLTTAPNGTTPRQRNDGSGSNHRLGTRCTSCHPHSNGFDR
jgi:predicted CXXCH cytochrome family protein